jgi:hypothetical protein
MPPTPLFWALAGVALLSVAVQTRPPAAEFAAEVAYRRQVKSDLKAGRQPRPRSALAAAAFAGRDWDEESGHADGAPPAPAPPLFGIQRWPDGTWAADVALVSLGCTRKGCLIGALSLWWKPPNWPMEWDLYLLVAVHGYSTFCPSATYFRHFSPRARVPHSVLLGSVATRSTWGLLWVSSTLVGLGAELQQALGRLGFLGLYAAGGLAASLVSMTCRRTAHGHGGVLAACAFHTLVAPHARHNLMGVELGAQSALAAQVGLACSAALQGDAPGPVLLANFAPCAVAAFAFGASRMRVASRVADVTAIAMRAAWGGVLAAAPPETAA